MKNMKGLRTAAVLLLVFAMVFGNALAGRYDISEGSVYVYATENDQTVSHGDNETVSDPDPVITGTTSENTVRIEADAGAKANVTFDGLNIDVGTKDNTPAVKTEGAGDVNIELDGASRIKSGNASAGLQKENGGTLTIDDRDLDGGSLAAEGGYTGAGIGGGAYHDGENITINGGKVNAGGAAGAAGIGGGYSGGDGRYITINGGEVTATGGGTGAGIGGGDRGNGEHITITGGEVNASGLSAAGIGGGGGIGKGQDITITGGTVTANGGYNASGIGGGEQADGKNISIGGDAVVFVAGGQFGAGIGGGINNKGTEISVSQSAQVSVAGGSAAGLYSLPAGIGDGSVFEGDAPGDSVNTENLYKTGKITVYNNGTSTDQMKGDSPTGTVKETIEGTKECSGHVWTGGSCLVGPLCSICGWRGEPEGHDLIHQDAKAPTCTEAGTEECWICTRDGCGRLFSDAEGKNCIKKPVAVPAKGHEPAAAVKENEKAAGAGVPGSYDEVVYCTECGAEVSRRTVAIKADDISALLAQMIRQAPENGTVEMDAGESGGLTKIVFGALDERPDVSLKLQTKAGRIVVPAGFGLSGKTGGKGRISFAELKELLK